MIFSDIFFLSCVQYHLNAILVNLSNDTFTVNPGERIAQMVVAKYEKVEWDQVESLDETERGEGGFGSTGL